MTRRYALALLAAAAGCHGRRREPPSPQYLPPPAARESVAFSAPFDVIARVVGLPALHSVALPRQSREVRIGGSFSMFGDAFAIRLVEQPGHAPSGTLFRVWGQWRADSVPPLRRTRCTPWIDGKRDCVFVWRHAYDWPTIAARLDSLGVWTISEPCQTDNVSVMDAGDLSVQRLQGSVADTYFCNAPRYRNSASGRRASLLLDYLDSLVGVVEHIPPDVPPPGP